MNDKLELLIDFILMFLLIYILISVFFNKKRKDYSKLKDNDYVKTFIIKYNLNMKKTDYKKVLNTLTIINSFILAISTIIMLQIKSTIYKILVVFIVIMLLIYSLYEISGRYFKNKEK